MGITALRDLKNIAYPKQKQEQFIIGMLLILIPTLYYNSFIFKQSIILYMNSLSLIKFIKGAK